MYICMYIYIYAFKVHVCIHLEVVFKSFTYVYKRNTKIYVYVNTIFFVYLFIYMCTYVNLYVDICYICFYIFLHVHIYTYTNTFTHAHVHFHTCTHAHTPACWFVCTDMYLHTLTIDLRIPSSHTFSLYTDTRNCTRTHKHTQANLYFCL